MQELQQILFQTLVIFFFILSIFAIVVGVGLIVARKHIFRLFEIMNRYVSTRQAMKPASMPHDIGPTVQRYRWWFGGALLLGATFSIYSLGCNFDQQRIVHALVAISDGRSSPAFIQALVQGLRWFMLVTSAIAIVVALMLFFAPRALATLDARANRWYSVRKVTAGSETMHFALDRWVETHPALAGALIAIGGVVVLVSSASLLFAA